MTNFQTDDLPALFLLIGAATTGVFDESSDMVDRTPVCEACGRTEPKFGNVVVKLDHWRGQALVSVFGMFFVTGELRTALQDAEVTGIELQEVSMVGSTRRPERLHRLTVTGSADGPDSWWEPTGDECSSCGQIKRMPTRDGIRSSMVTDDPIPLRVSATTWDGTDAFVLPSAPTTPVVTDRFVAALTSISTKDVHLRPTDFVREK